MCGIAGFINPKGFEITKARNIGKSMAHSMKHRGPDDVGFWADSAFGVMFVHQRLSIIDLTNSAHQPMLSASGRYILCYNGEVYNHQELRHELNVCKKAPIWRGHSDTETILACIDTYGLKKTLTKLVGMFALALWDKSTNEVLLARDRIGEKPLYYGQNGELLFFGSELKALRAHPDFMPEVNRDVISLYLRYNYIPQPHSIYKGIKKLPPGHFVKLKKNSKPEAFWSLNKVVNSRKLNSIKVSETGNLKILNNLLKKVVEGQMQADVPLGAFLSGGVDSSLIVALMQEQSFLPINTFSIGFENKYFNEAPFAKEVAKHLCTKHHELYISDKTARDVITHLPTLYDEPFSDSSQIPTFLISQMAQKHVKVSLTGDGGDELFSGYNRYKLGHKFWPKLRLIPSSLRFFIAKIITTLPPSSWDKVLGPALYLAPNKFKYYNIGEKLYKTASIFDQSTIEDIYKILISNLNKPENIIIGSKEPKTILTSFNDLNHELTSVEKMMYYDMLMYLPDDILVKVDRAAMGVSLETRTPFLDHRLVELAWQLPFNMKIRNGINKWCLRKLLYKRVPKHLIERPKMGFGVPIGEWLRGPLRDWTENLLNERKIKESGYFDSVEIQKKWQEHLSGQYNWHYFLWNILMFESWKNEAGL